MSRLLRLLLVLTCAALLSTMGCNSDPCETLAADLAAAASGDRLTLGACRAEGEFVVPEGVILVGIGESTVLSSASGVVVTLAPGSRLESLAIESDGDAGLVATGTGDAVSIADVTVTATRGVGIRIEDVRADLSRVELHGPITEANAMDIPPNPAATDTATHGLVVRAAGIEGDPVVLEDVTISGFARFGAYFEDSVVAWSGGGAIGNLAVGVMGRGGRTTLSSVEITDTYEGVQPYPAYGAVFHTAARVDTVDVMASNNDGYGFLHAGGVASHANLTAESNGEPALWVEAADSFELSGVGTRIADNLLAGVVLMRTTDAMIQDATIASSRMSTRIPSSGDPVMVGDGVHAVLPTAAMLHIDRVTLTNNDRVGVLLDVDDGLVDGVVMDVSVDGTGSSLGAIAQSLAGLIASGTWDSGITRLGTTAANDAALTGPLEKLGIVAPMF